jgi:hypothetical protein
MFFDILQDTRDALRGQRTVGEAQLEELAGEFLDLFLGGCHALCG